MRKRIILSLFALFLFFTVGTVIATVYMSSNIAELKNIVTLQEVEQLRRSLIIKIQNVQTDLYTVNTPYANELDFIVNEAADLESTAQKCTSCHHPQRLLSRIENVKALIENYRNSLSYYITVSANAERMEKLKSDAAGIGKTLLSLTGEMSHSASKSLEDLTRDAMRRLSYVKIMLLITVLVTFFLGVMVAVSLTKSITNPINELVNATRLIASGKFGSTTSYKDETEFGELAKHFNTMSTAIKDGYGKIRQEMDFRRQTEEALRESEEKLQSVFNQMQDGFYRTDKEGRIIWASPSAAKMLKYGSTDDLIGHDFSEFFAYPNKRQFLLQGLSNKGKVTNFEAELRRGDGSTIIVSINSHFYLNKEGSVEGEQGVCRDITERKKLEDEQLKIEKLESLGILAGGIAHDFNNILTTIVGNIKLAKISANTNENIYEVLADAEDACRRAKDLTGQLLTFSKGGMPIKKTASIKGQLKDSASFALKGSNVNGEFLIPDDLWLVEIDEGQMNQVIYNLVINAIQAMPKGGTICIKAENVVLGTQSKLPIPNGDHILITVKDEGVGIPKDYIPKIFDPYFTTKQRGSGLGLASTYSIIKNHYGYIGVESDVGAGTTFYIYLPAVKGELSLARRRTEKILKGEGRVLLMDDDDTVLTTIGKMLKQLGYEVVLAKDGVEAIELYQQARGSSKPFDVVMMDLTIRGGMGGQETIKRLRELDPAVKAIASSGYSTDTVLSDFSRHGFCGIITKPYEIEELSKLLNCIITGVG